MSYFRALASFFELRNRSHRVKRRRNRGVGPLVPVRARVSIVPLEFAANFDEKLQKSRPRRSQRQSKRGERPGSSPPNGPRVLPDDDCGGLTQAILHIRIHYLSFPGLLLNNSCHKPAAGTAEILDRPDSKAILVISGSFRMSRVKFRAQIPEITRNAFGSGRSKISAVSAAGL